MTKNAEEKFPWTLEWIRGQKKEIRENVFGSPKLLGKIYRPSNLVVLHKYPDKLWEPSWFSGSLGWILARVTWHARPERDRVPCYCFREVYKKFWGWKRTGRLWLGATMHNDELTVLTPPYAKNQDKRGSE